MLLICFLLLFGYNNITWLKKPLAPDLRAYLFSIMKKKRSCSLRSNCILIFQTSTFRGSILRCLTIVCVNAVIISATIDPEDCILTTISAQPGLYSPVCWVASQVRASLHWEWGALRRTCFQLLTESQPFLVKIPTVTQPTSLRCSARSDDSTYRPERERAVWLAL